jgi:hypothetical protein
MRLARSMAYIEALAGAALCASSRINIEPGLKSPSHSRKGPA